MPPRELSRLTLGRARRRGNFGKGARRRFYHSRASDGSGSAQAVRRDWPGRGPSARSPHERLGSTGADRCGRWAGILASGSRYPVLDGVAHAGPLDVHAKGEAARQMSKQPRRQYQVTVVPAVSAFRRITPTIKEEGCLAGQSRRDPRLTQNDPFDREAKPTVVMGVDANRRINFQPLENAGVPNRIRTGVAAVKGRCPRPLDDGDVRGARCI